jgi:hypothetical protein
LPSIDPAERQGLDERSRRHIDFTRGSELTKADETGLTKPG